MSLPEMPCREVVEVVNAYLEGALSRRDRRRFEEHLAGCEGCRNYLEQMRRTIHLTGRMTENSIPRTARADLLRLFRGWRSGSAG